MLALFPDVLRLLRSILRSHSHLAAENLFLRKQLACYVERRTRPKRPDSATRIILALLSRVVAWRELLTIVRPETLVRWHRDLYRLCWRMKSRPRGRPRIPAELQQLIADMAVANRTWGEERIAAELRVNLGLTVSPRTIRRYMRRNNRPRPGQSTQSWATFLHNHAGSVLACDFFVVVTATFQRLYVFVVLDISTRRILHWNVTEQPTAEWTIQQFRNGLPLDATYRFVIHDRDAIFASAVDDALRSMSLEVLRTPPRAPQANAYCERLIGTARRECLDWIIPLNERHLRHVLAEWIPHYNAERPHSALGPGLPDASAGRAALTGHHLSLGWRVVAHQRLGGLHHHYELERAARLFAEYTSSLYTTLDALSLAFAPKPEHGSDLPPSIRDALQ
jgi:putative transposase